MRIIGLEPTNRCNRRCRHCFCNKADPLSSLPLDTAESILAQGEALGFKMVYLTGGEVALYPQLGEMLRLIAGHGFDFTLATNGYRFRDYVLPLLLEPGIKERLAYLSFSLDGATASTHDGLRGPKSFREVSEALLLCQDHQLPFNLKTVFTTANLDELPDLALLGARLGAVEHDFLYPLPTPGFIRDGLLPSPWDLERTVRALPGNLGNSTHNKINVDGFSLDGVMLNCGNLVDDIYVDHQGNLIFCCILSHVTEGDGVPASSGGEVLADLKEVTLTEGIVRQFRKAAEVMEARLMGGGRISGLSPTPCLWCLDYFGKLAWLKDFPESPWASWLGEGRNNLAQV